MKTFVMLSVVCFFLIIETFSRTVKVRSNDYESDEEASSSEEVQKIEERSLSSGYSDLRRMEPQRLITRIRYPIHPALPFYTFFYTRCPRLVKVQNMFPNKFQVHKVKSK